jgi:hypothetical protein
MTAHPPSHAPAGPLCPGLLAGSLLLRSRSLAKLPPPGHRDRELGHGSLDMVETRVRLPGRDPAPFRGRGIPV